MWDYLLCTQYMYVYLVLVGVDILDVVSMVVVLQQLRHLYQFNIQGQKHVRTTCHRHINFNAPVEHPDAKDVQRVDCFFGGSWMSSSSSPCDRESFLFVTTMLTKKNMRLN